MCFVNKNGFAAIYFTNTVQQMSNEYQMVYSPYIVSPRLIGLRMITLILLSTHNYSLTNELTKVSISKQAMGEFIDSNHIAELAIVQNMNKLYDVITDVGENYTLAWHNDHSHSIVGLRDPKILNDTSCYKAMRNFRSIYHEHQQVKVDFRQKQLNIATV